MKSFVGVCAVIAAGLMALPASATAYLFSGHPTPTNSGAGNILNYVGRNAPMTFEFTTAADLAPSLAFASRLSVPTSWTASGGSAGSTIDSGDTAAKLSIFQFSTDSAGNLLKYNISVTATNTELPGKQWTYQFSNFDPANVFERVELDTLQFNGVIHFTTLDSALICTNTCGGSALGSFSRLNDPAPGIPEPASWAMMIGGLGLAGAMLRSRRGGVAAA